MDRLPIADDQLPANATCLFTGDALTAETKTEHTIPQAVAGRIKSRIVSSDRFNEAAGKTVDQALAGAFAPVFNRLGLVTPASHRTPSVGAFIRGDNGRYEFGKNGRFQRRGFAEERDPKTHQLVSVVGADVAQVTRRLGRPGKVDLAPSPPGTRATIDVPLLDLNIEIAALKSVLLTFDHLLAPDQDRFTRRPELAAVRCFVRDYVLAGKFDQRVYDQVAVGIQYDKLRELQELRRRAARPATPFEHVMVAAADPATRTLDAVWWLASIDPYGFRLCSDWRGKPFTLVVASGILRDTDTCMESVPIEFHCRVAARLRATQPRGVTKQQLDAIAGEIAVHHRDAVQRATDHAERHCPDFVRDCVERMAQINLQERRDARVVSGLRRYIESAFEWRLADPVRRAEFERIVELRIGAAPGELLGEAVNNITAPPAKLTWDQWHRLYVSILDDLRTPFGLPGEVDRGESTLAITQMHGRVVDV